MTDSKVRPTSHRYRQLRARAAAHPNTPEAETCTAMADKMLAAHPELAGADEPELPQYLAEYRYKTSYEYPGAPACADELRVTVHLAEKWSEGWSNASEALFTDRAAAIAAKLPPGAGEGRLFCALAIAAASAACAGTAIVGPLGIPGCALGALTSLCKCDTFRKAWPKVDWDGLCN